MPDRVSSSARDRVTHERFYSTWMMPDNRKLTCCDDKDCAVKIGHGRCISDVRPAPKTDIPANGRFAPQAADQKRPLGREQRSRRF
jgi:hypothetical protein